MALSGVVDIAVVLEHDAGDCRGSDEKGALVHEPVVRFDETDLQ